VDNPENMLLKKNGGHFSKWPTFKTTFDHISAHSVPRVVILVAIPRFWGLPNPLEQSGYT
jgi:hypothetical protein